MVAVADPRNLFSNLDEMTHQGAQALVERVRALSRAQPDAIGAGILRGGGRG